MRWFWIDRFESFVHGESACAIKNVSLAEEYVDQQAPAYPWFPSSLIVEGLAQTSGLLVGEYNGFRERVVLAKVSRASFSGFARPGDTLTYEAILEDVRDDGAIASTQARIGDQLIASVDLMFAHLDDRIAGHDLFYPADFLCMLRILRLYDVGRMPNGDPLTIPEHLLEAEKQAVAERDPSIVGLKGEER